MLMNKNLLFFSLFFLYLGSFDCASRISKGNNDPSFISEQKFSRAQCEELHACKSCSFLEVKELKECLVSGYVRVRKCTKFNEANVVDRFDYHVYDPCDTEGVGFRWVHLFVVNCILLLLFFGTWLNKYRSELENKLYEKL